MKKVVALFTMAMCFTAGSVMAQGGGGQMTPEQRVARLKERLKDVTLTAPQMDSVIAIYSDNSAMANFRDLSPEERQTKMKEVSDARIKRMEKAGLPAETAKKVSEALSFRPGGGRPGGGGGRK